MLFDPVIVQECWFFDQIATHFVAIAYFTTELNLLLSITNKISDSGDLRHIKGAFDVEGTMKIVCELSNHLYPDINFRQRRRILMDYGKMLATLMRKIDSIDSIATQSDEVNICIKVNQYGLLDDIEWIEDVMCEDATKVKRNYPYFE